MHLTSTLLLGIGEEEEKGLGCGLRLEMHVDHFKAEDESPGILVQLNQTNANHTKNIYFKEDKRMADTWFSNEVSIKHHESVCVIASSLFVKLSRLEDNTLYIFIFFIRAS